MSERTSEDRASAGTDRSVDHVTDHWAGVGPLTAVLVGIGLFLRNPQIVLLAVLGATFLGYTALSSPGRIYGPEGGASALTIRREFDDPDPGDEVAVTVEVRNEGAGLLSDVRIVDGVPEELEVVDGSPRHGDVLTPGGRTRFSYTVAVSRGEYRWQPTQVAIADPSGTVERETRVHAETTLECVPPPFERPQRELPLRELTTNYPGRIETDTGGPGLEFHSAREYRPNDPFSRVDWHRLARTGELSTLQFRQERMARVMLVIDTRRAAYLAPGPAEEHAVERSVDAARRLFVALLDSGNLAGITAFGPIERDCWLSPSSGDEHRARARELLSTHRAFSPRPPDRELYERYRDDRRETLKQRRIQRLHERLPPDTQVVLLSPCCDEYVPSIARRLDAYGNPVTVISPDPTTDESPIEELAQLERTDRLANLRGAGIRVLDWPSEAPFLETMARAQQRWSA